MKSTNAKMKVEWAWINAHKDQVTLAADKEAQRKKQFRLCFGNRTNTSKVPDHIDVMDSRDIQWLHYDNMKVAVAFRDKGLPAHIFKALEYVQFYDETGGHGDLLDYLEAEAQKIKLGMKIFDDRGRYTIKIFMHVEAAACKAADQLLPTYLVVDGWTVSSGDGINM